ncbi:RNA polymerase sigma factor [Sphingobacterium griseoflavum]|uniref:RNA polymerase sigma-70 factor n=1 Tax=Sphingobacterium griseoflavum TaxID=1474952 RepID=A0ABQ3I2J4_9SPHI|nr:RNA polymerase sigma-70 factor [Sphingobacterium griseoflavum]GHE48638.1 RNA polymerase sigma-70 factor [Sphingobacterium griseoflavum]
MTKYSHYRDAELVQRMSQGDHTAYLEIYDRYKAPLQQHAWKKLGQAQDVQDVIQEMFTELWLRRKDLVLHTGLANYLFRAVRNRSLNLIYKRRKESHYLDSLDEFIREGNYLVDLQIREKEFEERIRKEIANLPARMQEVFKLSRDEGLSHKQIAERLGTSEHTISKQITNALKTLREKLGPLYFIIYLIF